MQPGPSGAPGQAGLRPLGALGPIRASIGPQVAAGCAAQARAERGHWCIVDIGGDVQNGLFIAVDVAAGNRESADAVRAHVAEGHRCECFIAVQRD